MTALMFGITRDENINWSKTPQGCNREKRTPALGGMGDACEAGTKTGIGNSGISRSTLWR